MSYAGVLFWGRILLAGLQVSVSPLARLGQPAPGRGRAGLLFTTPGDSSIIRTDNSKPARHSSGPTSHDIPRVGKAGDSVQTIFVLFSAKSVATKNLKANRKE